MKTSLINCRDADESGQIKNKPTPDALPTASVKGLYAASFSSITLKETLQTGTDGNKTTTKRHKTQQHRVITLCVFVFSFTAPPTVRIVHSGQACNVEEERYSERVYTIKEGETLELQCLVTGHPRPQVRGGGGPNGPDLYWSERFED